MYYWSKIQNAGGPKGNLTLEIYLFYLQHQLIFPPLCIKSKMDIPQRLACNKHIYIYYKY